MFPASVIRSLSRTVVVGMIAVSLVGQSASAADDVVGGGAKKRAPQPGTKESLELLMHPPQPEAVVVPEPAAWAPAMLLIPLLFLRRQPSH
jgi:hypothetical protein